MTAIIKSIHKIDNEARCFASHHTYFAFAAMLIGTPVFLIMAVFAVTMLIALPMSLIFG